MSLPVKMFFAGILLTEKEPSESRVLLSRLLEREEGNIQHELNQRDDLIRCIGLFV